MEKKLYDYIKGAYEKKFDHKEIEESLLRFGHSLEDIKDMEKKVIKDMINDLEKQKI